MGCAHDFDDPGPLPAPHPAGAAAPEGSPDLDKIRSEHQLQVSQSDWGVFRTCGECGKNWPCEMRQMAVLVDAQAERLARAEATTHRVPPCDYCGESIGVYGWMRPGHSSVAPRALCTPCMAGGSLTAELDAARAALAQAEAEAGALRDALQAEYDDLMDQALHEVCNAGNFDGGSHDACDHCRLVKRTDAIASALAPGAGAALLARLETAERERDALKRSCDSIAGCSARLYAKRERLIGWVEGLRADLAAAVRRAEALEPYAKHNPTCDWNMNYGQKPCSCGLAAALGLAGAEGEAKP